VKPWFHRLPKTKSLVVNKGLANDGVLAIAKRVKAYPESAFDGFPLNVSVAKTNSPGACKELDAIDDYIGSLKILEAEGVGVMYTLNISCPNTFGGEPFTTPEKLERLLTAVDVLDLSKPVFIKTPSDLPWEKLKKLLGVAAKHDITGVTIHNLAKDRSKMKLLDPLPDSIKGNMSGKPTWETSNEFIRRTRLEFGERFIIFGVGGIFSAEDAYTKIRLGANMVELITGMIFEGPQLIGDINRGLVRLLKRDGFSNVGEAVGADLG
jgi:dihydroorotate dehydrogenase (fumarate)